MSHDTNETRWRGGIAKLLRITTLKVGNNTLLSILKCVNAEIIPNQQINSAETNEAILESKFLKEKTITKALFTEEGAISHILYPI